MALRQITGAKLLQEMQLMSLQAWASRSQHRHLNVSTSCSEKKDQPDERTVGCCTPCFVISLA